MEQNPIFLLIMIVSVLFSVGAYILTAWAMYGIAVRRGIEKAWLAWIPIGNNWILGSISDDYQLNVRYSTKSIGKLLLWLSIFVIALSLILLLCSLVVIQSALRMDPDQLLLHGSYIDFMAPVRENLKTMLWIFVFLIVALSAQAIAQYVALFDLYRSCCPEHSVWMLVFSIAFPVALPVFLLCVHRQDNGYSKRNLFGI